jgi:hypothetical protein
MESEWTFTETFKPIRIRTIVARMYPPADVDDNPIDMILISQVCINTLTNKLSSYSKIKFPSGKVMAVKAKKEMNEDEIDEAMALVDKPIDDFITKCDSEILDEKELKFEKTDTVDQMVKKIDDSNMFDIGYIPKN